MSDLRNVVVRGINGDTVASFQMVNVSQTTGRELRQMTASLTGFAPVCVQLIDPCGNAIDDNLALRASLEDDGLREDDVALVCKLAQLQLVGPKSERMQNFGGKGGLMLTHRINDMKRSRGFSVCNLRVPEPSLRSEVRYLILDSFAPHLGPLIDVALDAAHQSCPSSNVGDSTGPITTQSYSYEDAERGAFADLSSCQLWTRVCKNGAQESGDAIVVAAVLWRLIFGWNGRDGGQFNRGGPVLEVLFLATAPGMRESGHALELAKELEEVAISMGCCAMSVAAVPCQGVSFWSRADFSTIVRLNDTDVAETERDVDVVFQEPASPFGIFLLQNMLLFTDTPLVAKVLEPNSPMVRSVSAFQPMQAMSRLLRPCLCCCKNSRR